MQFLKSYLSVIILSILQVSGAHRYEAPGSSRGRTVGNNSTTTKGHQDTRSDTFECDFTGDVAIKNQCGHFFRCYELGKQAQLEPCPKGKFFDHILRHCTAKTSARCVSKLTCPSDGTTYASSGPENDERDHLVCLNGVPYPVKCHKGHAYDDSSKTCVKSTSGQQGRSTSGKMTSRPNQSPPSPAA